jgi:hypothetical protein
MFFYEVSYTTWEECPQTILSHDEVYTQEQFNEILLDAYVEVSRIEEVRHNEWYSEWLSSDDAKEDREIFGDDYNKYRPSVGMLYSNVVDYLVKEKGFKHLEITSQFCPSDTYELVPTDEREFRDTEDEFVLMLRQRFNVIEPRDSKINDILS